MEEKTRAQHQNTYRTSAKLKTANHDRRPHDEYPTPYSLTEQFLRDGFLDPALSTFEPSCGNDMAIVKMLYRCGFTDVTETDIQRGDDFLNHREQFDQVIMNPPFKDHMAHVAKAKEVARLRFACLLPLDYLTGKERHSALFSDRNFPLSRVYIFTRPVDFSKPLRRDGKFVTSAMNVAWYCFERNHKGSPTMHWLDNSPYIVRAADRPARSNVVAFKRRAEKQKRTSYPDAAFIEVLGPEWMTAVEIRKEMTAKGLKVVDGTVFNRMRKIVTSDSTIEAAPEPERWRVRFPAS